MTTAVQSPPGAAPDTGADISPAEMFRRIYRLFYNKRFGLWLIFAMTFLSLLGVLFTQVPAETRADPARYASFLESVQPKYRGWTMPLSALGVFHMFSSWPFRIVNILLVLSIIACTTHRLPTLWRNATKPHTHVREGFFDHARTHRSTVVAGDADAILADARTKLAHKRFRIIQDETADGLNLYADRNRWMPLGTALAHAAFCLILLGVLVTNNTGFHDDEFTVPVGMGPQAVGHDTGLSIEAKSFTDSYHDDGSPMDYAAEVVLYQDGQKLKEHTLRVNAPLKQGRVMFNQSYFGFAADLTAKDASGKELLHQGVPLQYQTQDQTQNYGKTTLANGMQVYVVAPASGQTDARIGPGQVLVEVYDQGSTEPKATQVISQGKPTDVGGVQLTFNRERQFTGLMVSKDNGAPLVWLGSLLLVAGMICTMFFRHQRLWIRIHPGADGNRVRVASPDKHDTLFENEVTKFVDSLGTPVPGSPTSTTAASPTTIPEPASPTTIPEPASPTTIPEPVEGHDDMTTTGSTHA